MALRDTWRRALEYFGLVEGDYIEEGEYTDEHEVGSGTILDEPAPGREPGTVSPLRRRSRRSEIDDIFAEEEPATTRRRSLRAVEPAPSGNGGSDVQMHFVQPRNFNDAQSVADEFKRSKPVILNLQGADRELAKRLIDFASGLTYALNGGMQRIAERVFLLTPRNVEVSAEDRARILERGFFNQS
jgi:cell division inhibitor SepF